MDVLEEKQNGAPPMEIDEVVSVRDRKLLPFCCTSLRSCRHLHLADEAFSAKHMPDLGHDVKDFKVSTWRLNTGGNWKRTLVSPEFDCGGHKW